VLTASAAHAEISNRDMQVLSKSQLIYIATVRKDGNQSKAAPVWFTVSARARRTDSDRAHHLEGKADSPRQSRYRLDRPTR